MTTNYSDAGTSDMLAGVSVDASAVLVGASISVVFVVCSSMEEGVSAVEALSSAGGGVASPSGFVGVATAGGLETRRRRP